VPIRGFEQHDPLTPVHLDGRSWLGDVAWFDAHTHMGHADPDGSRADPEEIVAGLDAARQQRALIFAMQEPGGYAGPNDAVLAAAAASGGRLVGMCRVDPKDPGAVEEARRCLDAGAVGIKLHPRSDAFGLPHPTVDRLVALAASRRAPVLFHAGRGIPELGSAAVALAREHPGARIILAHAGISDLGALLETAVELENLFFDTAWWQVGDVLQLYSGVPPARILYASDMPYGPGTFASFLFLRAGRQAGLSAEQLTVMAGEQLRRVVAGEDPLPLGPATGDAALGPRSAALERVTGHTGSAIQLAFRGGDPAEPLALARLGCQCPPSHPHAELLAAAAWLIDRAEADRAAAGDALACVPAALTAHALCGTPAAGVPAALQERPHAT
jgi:predicted TIM-barrel fold metal-dependent hydrolase